MAYSTNKKIGGLDQFTAAGQTPKGDPLLGDNDNLIVEQSGTAKRARVIDLIKKVFNLTTTFNGTTTSDAAIIVQNDGSFGKVSVNSLVPSTSVTNTMLVGGISNDKLQTIDTPGKVTDRSTSATPGFNVGNTAYDSANNDKIVKRNGSGNFAAGTITATLSGNASTASNISGKTANAVLFQSAASVTGEIISDSNTSGKFLKSNGPNTPPSWESFAATSTVADDLTIAGPGLVYQTAANVTTWLANGSSVGSILSSNGTSNQPVWVAAQATPATGDTIVKRDGSGDFTGQTITANVGFSGGSVSGTTGTFSGAVSTGALTGTTGTFSGAVSGTTGTFSGAVSGTTGTFSAAVSGTTGTFTGAVSGTTGTFSGNTSINGTLSSGNASVTASGALLSLVNSAAAVNQKIWDFVTTATGLQIRARNDLGSAGGNTFDFARSSEQVNEFSGSNSGNKWFVVDNLNQRVGIGTAAPSARLTVTHPGNVSYGTAIQVMTTGGTDDPMIALENWNGGSPVRYGIAVGDAGSLLFRSGGWTGSFGTDRMCITNDGNVGIGTSSPSTKLHVVGNSLITLSTWGTSGEPTLYLGDTNNYISTAFGGATNLCAYNALRFITGSTPAERLRITADGNVGVGTSSPLAKLNIAGSFRADGAQTDYTGIQLINASGAEAQFHANGNGSVDLRAVTNHPLTILTNNQERLRITADGNVGIGTSTPTQKLDVNGVVNATGFMRNGTLVVYPRWCTFLASGLTGNGVLGGVFGSGISSVAWSSADAAYSVAFSEALPNENYAVVVTTSKDDVSYVTNKTTTGFLVKLVGTSANARPSGINYSIIVMS